MSNSWNVNHIGIKTHNHFFSMHLWHQNTHIGTLNKSKWANVNGFEEIKGSYKQPRAHRGLTYKNIGPFASGCSHLNHSHISTTTNKGHVQEWNKWLLSSC